MRVTVRVTGAASVQGVLARLANEGGKVARREVKRAALNVQNGAKRRAPVDTGRLRNSIAHEVLNDGLDARIGTNVEYAPRIEFGFQGMVRAHQVRAHVRRAPSGELRPVRAHSRGPYPVQQRARPFLFPALEEERPQFERRIREALKGAIR